MGTYNQRKNTLTTILDGIVERVKTRERKWLKMVDTIERRR